eukprot:SAG31_NODE_3452_length_4253_cov_10.720270_3_plen_245_part_00
MPTLRAQPGASLKVCELTQGTCKYIHVSCLNTWRQQYEPTHRHFVECDLCHFKYRLYRWENAAAKFPPTNLHPKEAHEFCQARKLLLWATMCVAHDTTCALFRPVLSRVLLAPHTLLLASGLGMVVLTTCCGMVAIKLRRLAHWYVAWRDPAVAANQRMLASKRVPMVGAVGPAVGGATELAPPSLLSIIFSGVGLSRALQTGFFFVGALGFVRLMWALLVCSGQNTQLCNSLYIVILIIALRC